MGKELEAYKNTPEGAFWEKAGELIKEGQEGYPAIEDDRLLRKELVQALRIENPCFTLQEIGNRAGITREAVRLILKGSDLETKSGNFGKKTIKVCATCGSIYRSTRPERKYCKKECFYKDKRVIVDLKGDLIEALKEESPNTKLKELAKRTKMSSSGIYRLLKSRDLPTK